MNISSDNVLPGRTRSGIHYLVISCHLHRVNIMAQNCPLHTWSHQNEFIWKGFVLRTPHGIQENRIIWGRKTDVPFHPITDKRTICQNARAIISNTLYLNSGTWNDWIFPQQSIPQWHMCVLLEIKHQNVNFQVWYGIQQEERDIHSTRPMGTQHSHRSPIPL